MVVSRSMEGRGQGKRSARWLVGGLTIWDLFYGSLIYFNMSPNFLLWITELDKML